MTKREFRKITAGAILIGIALSAQAIAGERAAQSSGSYGWCRQLSDAHDAMLKNEGFGISSCNDRAKTPYQPWHSATPLRRSSNGPMTSSTDWSDNNGLMGYDQSYDDHYDRRYHRYR